MIYHRIKNLLFLIIILGIVSCTSKYHQDKTYKQNKSSEADPQLEFNNEDKLEQEFKAFLQQEAEARRYREEEASRNTASNLDENEIKSSSAIQSNESNSINLINTSTRMIPPNQRCPQLSLKLVKQEIIRNIKICFYK